MEEIKTYKCPNCDGAISFDASTQKMKCPYCKTEIDVNSLSEYEEIKANEEADHFGWNEVNFDNILVDSENLKYYICDSCGGEIIGDASMASSSCPYCGNPIIVEKQFEGILKPDYVIPFKYNLAQAKDKMFEHFKGKILLPKDFKTISKLEKVSGLYIPYWLFDAKANGSIRYRATRTRYYTSGDYNITETLHFRLYREGLMNFSKVPNDATLKFDEKMLEALEPYDFREIMDFKTAYLQGYLSDRYEVKPEDCKSRVNERMRNSMIEELSKTTGGYSGVVVESSHLNFDDGKIYYAMLPIYILHLKYHNNDYTFAMNGQTGKFVGNLPMDISKLLIYSSFIFILSMALIFLIIYMF